MTLRSTLERMTHGPVHLSRGILLSAAALVLAGAAIAGLAWWVSGPIMAQAVYLSLLLMFPAIRAKTWNARLVAALWTILVAGLGFLVGGMSIWVTLAAVVGVALVQAILPWTELGSLMRSPVNLLAFAQLAATEVAFPVVLAGVMLGCAVIFVYGAFQHLHREPRDFSHSLGERAGVGAVLALGCVVLVLGAELLDFPYVSWALLSYCMIFAAGFTQRTSRAGGRVLGTIAGTMLATGAALLPVPVQWGVIAAATLLCVAYLRLGNYVLFMVCLTPAVLLLTSSDASPLMLGVGRLESVLAAAVVAIVFGWIAERVHMRWERTHGLNAQ